MSEDHKRKLGLGHNPPDQEHLPYAPDFPVLNIRHLEAAGAAADWVEERLMDFRDAAKRVIADVPHRDNCCSSDLAPALDLLAIHLGNFLRLKPLLEEAEKALRDLKRVEAERNN